MGGRKKEDSYGEGGREVGGVGPGVRLESFPPFQGVVEYGLKL